MDAGVTRSGPVHFPDYTFKPGEGKNLPETYIDRDYFKAAGIPLRMGRFFTGGEGSPTAQIAIVNEEVPALSALNMRLRDDYVADAAAGMTRWNRVFAETGIEFRITLPHVAFNRRIGEFAAVHADQHGNVMSRDAWERSKEALLPSADDNAFVASLMRPVRGRGMYAPWIAPPRYGIDNRAGDFEYVKIEG